MSNRPALKDQFRFPTVTQRRDDEKWETVIGVRNIVVTAETLMAGVLSNESIIDGSVLCSESEMRRIAKDVAYASKILLEEVDELIS